MSTTIPHRLGHDFRLSGKIDWGVFLGGTQIFLQFPVSILSIFCRSENIENGSITKFGASTCAAANIPLAMMICSGDHEILSARMLLLSVMQSVDEFCNNGFNNIACQNIFTWSKAYNRKPAHAVVSIVLNWVNFPVML